MPSMRTVSTSACWIGLIDTLRGDWLASGASIHDLSELWSSKTQSRRIFDFARIFVAFGASHILMTRLGCSWRQESVALSRLGVSVACNQRTQAKGLYSLVPPASVVPAQVHRTNILNHDPHYRHLPPLWEKLKDDREDRLLPPEERLARQLQLQLAYVSYVGLVIRRRLSGMVCAEWMEISSSVGRDGVSYSDVMYMIGS
jgi:hypothetical protein